MSRQPGIGARVQVPRSGVRGIRWPALPKRGDALVLSLLHQFEDSQWWPPETLRRMQLAQAERLIAHASRTVPFYGERLKPLKGIKKGGLGLEDWRRIPLLTRADIQDAGEALNSRRLPRDHGKAVEVSSSGSTGAPITVKTTMITGLYFSAFNVRLHLWHGRDFAAKTAAIRVLRGTHIEAAKTGRGVPWVGAHASGPMTFLDLRTPIDKQLEWLMGQKAEYILTYPSNLMGLLRLSEESGETPPNLRHVATMGEVLDDAVRAACERIWGVPVIDSYSAQELGMIALQCPDHPHYHVQSEGVMVEVLNGDDTPCGPGQSGRLVITDLHNFATPLIRYEIGDHAQVGEPCPCGRGLPVIKRILGRSRNLVTLPTGERYSQSFSLFKLGDIAPIRRVQLVQKTVEEIQIKVVADRELDDEEEKKLKKIITDGLGHAFALKLIYVDDLPLAASGKFEEFVSEVAP